MSVVPDVPRVAEITQVQIDAVERWHREPISNPFDPSEQPLLRLVCQQHEFNYRLWHEEDTARSPTVSDEEMARVKRAIDKLNQQRNDTIEKLDDAITEMLCHAGVMPADQAPMNTETPGSAIDRLSIMALRMYHYREQLQRESADEQHRAMVAQRIALCEQQHRDLSQSLQELLNDQFAGRKQHKTYRQMKMYNDPSLNPEIYRAGSAG